MHIYKLLGQYKSREIIKTIEKWFPEKCVQNVLKTDLNEEAYGTDQILFSLSDNYENKYGLDINFITVRKASLNDERYFTKNNNYFTADIRYLPIKDESFDLILSISTLDHFNNPGDFMRCLVELNRILKKNGFLFIAINNKHNRNFYWSLRIGRALHLIPYPINFYFKEEMQMNLKIASFTVLETAYLVNILSPMNYFCILLSRILSNRIVNYIAKMAIKNDSKYAWFIVAKCVKSEK